MEEKATLSNTLYKHSHTHTHTENVFFLLFAQKMFLPQRGDTSRKEKGKRGGKEHDGVR